MNWFKTYFIKRKTKFNGNLGNHNNYNICFSLFVPFSIVKFTGWFNCEINYINQLTDNRMLMKLFNECKNYVIQYWILLFTRNDYIVYEIKN